jgi:hypothetical protein
MIQFRCWYCNKRYTVKEQRIGERLTCTCNNTLRIPRRNDGNCRVRTPVDWLVETVVYGGAGGVLGLGLALLILSQFRWLFFIEFKWAMLVCLPLGGFLIGLFGGERGINWIGQKIRGQENR